MQGFTGLCITLVQLRYGANWKHVRDGEGGGENNYIFGGMILDKSEI
jgi:hypothetical protein